MNLKLSDVLRPECLAGSTVTVIYDSYSSAWQIPLVMLKELLEGGGFGVISNYSLPFQSLLRKARAVGLDVMKALETNHMAVIDLFGTRYSALRPDIPNVFYLDKVEPETINPKIERIYSNYLLDLIDGMRLLRIIYTLDGAALMLGEDHTLKLLNQTLAYTNARLSDSTLILALNQDVVSKRFVGWVSGVSDVLLLVRSYIGAGFAREYLYLMAAPCEDFEPAVYEMRVTRKKGTERFEIKKLSAPELGPPAEEKR